MSSWIIKRTVPMKKTIKPVSIYHDTSNSKSLMAIYLDFFAAYIHTQKNGESCNIWDLNGLIKLSFKSNPQLIYLKEKPEANALTISDYSNTIKPLKDTEIKKLLSKVMIFNSEFNNSINQAYIKASIKTKFDLGIHLPFENSVALYIDLIKAYQLKSKKSTLSIYVMATSYDIVKELIKLGDPSWTVISMSKIQQKDGEHFFNMMAEVKLMSTISSLILDFSQDMDRYIYMIHENQGDLDYFKEINNVNWFLI